MSAEGGTETKISGLEKRRDKGGTETKLEKKRMQTNSNKKKKRRAKQKTKGERKVDDVFAAVAGL